MSKNKGNLRHKLKKILIRLGLFYFLHPVYEFFYRKIINFSSGYRAKREKMLNFYSQFIKKGDLCFDVGAHMGNRVEIFLELGGKVIAVEPQEKCIEYLEKKFNTNPDFVLVKKGLAEKEGEMTLSVCEEADSVSTFSEKWKKGRFSNYEWSKKKTVSVTTLDNLIGKFGAPIFCKIDVEGFEKQVLKGLSSSIKYISFEFVKEFINETKECLDYLGSLGYKSFNYDIYETMNLQLPRWVSSDEILEKIQNSKDELLGGDIYCRA